MYEEGPPRIGIKYVYEFQAVKAYEDLVRTCGKSELSAVLELSGAQLNLSLTSDFNGRTVHYKSLQFRNADLQKLAQLTPEFTFVHIYPRQNTLLIAKPFRKAEFLSISHLAFRGALAGSI